MTAAVVVIVAFVTVAVWTELQLSLARRRDKYRDVQPPGVE